MRQALVITNAEAGSNDEASVEAALRVIRESGIDVTVEATSDSDDLKAALSTRGEREVFVAGGDGSLHAVVAALHPTGELAHTAIGLIPLGTGNDFARGLDLPLDPAAAAAVIVAGHRRPLDLLTDQSGGVVVNAVHVGVGADAGRQAQPLKPKLGKLGYAVGAVLAGVKTKGHRIRVVADDFVISEGRRQVLQVGVGNGVYVGGGTPLTPDADPGDGKVDVVVSFAVSPLSRLLYALRLNRGTHDKGDDVHMMRASTVRVRGSGLWCNADGELVGPIDEQTWTVNPAAMTMLVAAGDDSPGS